jgi:hypothetical protein
LLATAIDEFSRNITLTGIDTLSLTALTVSRSGVKPPISSARTNSNRSAPPAAAILASSAEVTMTSSLGMPKNSGEYVKRQDQNNQITQHSHVNIPPASQKRRWFISDGAG